MTTDKYLLKGAGPLRNFRLVKPDVDIREIRAELLASDMWQIMGTGPKSPITHRNTKRIQLRTNVSRPGTHYHDIHETVDLPAWNILDATRKFIIDFVEEIGGELGRVRVTNLGGNGEIVPHIDVGKYCAVRERYHLVINAPEGTLFRSGDEMVLMQEGELWWFDNKRTHSVKNMSTSQRTHLVFDIRPRWDQTNYEN